MCGFLVASLQIPKQEKTYATAINDSGRILINSSYKLNNAGYTYIKSKVRDKNNKTIFRLSSINNEILNNHESIWMKVIKIISVNDNGEIIAQGETIYGEYHVIFLTPTNSRRGQACKITN